jgi:RNA polymerase sigma-70 factor (family 1)
MSDNSINNLWVLAAEDSEAAFEKIFKLFYTRLCQFALTVLYNKEEAEEVVEDVFIKVWTNRKTLPAIDNLNYYLFVSVKHTAFNYLKKQNRNQVINLDEVKVQMGETSLNPEQSLISTEQIQRIQNSIEALPPRCKLIFKLIKEDGLRYKEVAGLLNISIKTVEAQMALAIGKIDNSLSLQKYSSPFASLKQADK